MTNKQAGAWALIATALAFLLVMALHPTHAGLPGPLGLTLNAAVHGLAIVVTPLWAFGGLALHETAGRDKPLSTLALVCWLLGTAAILIAATISGFVTPRTIEFGDGNQILHLSVWLNRAFASVNAALTAIAILLWSAAWPGGRAALALRLWGALVGLGILGWELSGTLGFSVHQTLIMVIAFVSWMIPAAWSILRAPAEQGRTSG
jgi:hypothetical protein